jgi:DNA gyrase subunit B
VTVQADEEHQAHGLVIEDRAAGYPRTFQIDLNFVQTGEFRTLTASYQDVRGLLGPVIVRMTASGPQADDAEEAATDAEATDTPAPRASVKRVEPSEIGVASIDELVELFIDAGKKGLTIGRYKGLGEMNPDTLWKTTMDPTVRTLLQVRAEDHTEADLMFTTLMGDQVEPRRKFIEDNALDVKNLDV